MGTRSQDAGGAASWLVTQPGMGEFVFPETLKRMRNWNQPETKDCWKRNEAERRRIAVDVAHKSKTNQQNFEKNNCDQKSHLGQVWNQKFSLEMCFSQITSVGENGANWSIEWEISDLKNNFGTILYFKCYTPWTLIYLHEKLNLKVAI